MHVCGPEQRMGGLGEMKSKTTQTQDILNHMKQYGGITPLEALERYGCMRLSARVYDLRQAGYPIRATNITRKNKRGGKSTFAWYTLGVTE